MGFRKVKTPNWEIPFADDTIKLAILRCYLIVPACLPGRPFIWKNGWIKKVVGVNVSRVELPGAGECLGGRTTKKGLTRTTTATTTP